MLMNLKIPLAAALLMTAASAFAQWAPTPTPAPGLGIYPSSTYSPPLLGVGTLGTFQMTTKPDDAAFDCSTEYNLHIPYASCTSQQAALRLSYIGPCGSSMACANYFRRIAPDPVQLQGQVDGEAAAKENAKQAALAGKTPAAASAPGTPGWQGPLLPDDMIQQDEKAVAEARKEKGVKDVVALGGGHIAKMRDDGTAEMCGRGSCEKPVPAETVKHPKIQEWVTNAEANRNYAGDSGFGVTSAPPGGGMRAQSNPPTGARGNPAAGSGPDSQIPSPSDNTPYNMGREVASQSAPKGGGASSGSGSSSRGDGSSVASTEENKVIARTGKDFQDDLDKDITFNVNLAVKNDVIPGVAASASAAFADGARTQTTNVDDTMDVSKHKAGPQASANSGAPDR